MKEQRRSVWMKRVLKRLRPFSTVFGTGLKIPPPLATRSCSILRYPPLLLIALAGLAHGEEFTSPNSLTEQCRILPPMPGVTLSKSDQAKEKELCGIDFYGGAVALCPKTWSTSAAVMVYDIKGSGLAPQAYESQRCATREGHERLAKFKMTMNQRNTSGTMSNSALMYYVLSRYLDTLVEVPVAVYRTIDKEVLGKPGVAAHASGQGSMEPQRVGVGAHGGTQSRLPTCRRMICSLPTGSRYMACCSTTRARAMAWRLTVRARRHGAPRSHGSSRPPRRSRHCGATRRWRAPSRAHLIRRSRWCSGCAN